MNKIYCMMKNKENYIKYGFLFLLLVISIVFCLIPNDSAAKVNDKSKNVDSYNAAFDKLINDNYEYSYREFDSKKNVLKIYTGSVINDENIGYFESNKEVFKYSCRMDKCYKVYTDHEEEFEFKISNYLRPGYIKGLLPNLKEEIKEDDSSRVYTYVNEEETVEIRVSLVLDNITNIIIKDSNYEYNLTYY